VSQFSLIALLVAELLYLTVRFDSQVLDQAASPWLRALAWSPQYLRVAITVSVVLLLFRGARRTWTPIFGPATASRAERLVWLMAHLASFALFFFVSTRVFDPVLANAHAAWWVLGWCASGVATIATWTLAFTPRRVALPQAVRSRAVIGVALLVGAGAWLSGYLTEELWGPLARYTFTSAGALLALIYPHVVSQPEALRLGTPTFSVIIAPACSGYEGIGLILAFLALYLWMFRHELRFPAVLVLLPIAALTAWTLNVLRIVALIAIGNAGWRGIALGGFHSQAGWLAFNAMALGFLVVLNRGRFFMKTPGRADERDTDATTAYLAPFLVVLGTAMITGALSTGMDWLYPVRVIAALWLLWVFRRSYANLDWTLSWRAVAIGCATFVVWISLVPAGPRDGWPAALTTAPLQWAAAWLVVRVIGYTVTVPLVEELAFRGYLTRRLMQVDFDRLPVGMFSWWSFAASSLLFGALHGGMWLAGTIAGMTFAIALYQRRALGDAVVAHATTNGLIAMYVFATGRWSMLG
jgi:exosortase E/protease (VPEID-CTERM system)